MSDLVLEVKGLCKEYPKFRLENVSFSVPRACIMGFIGRNGAGKTTTLKSILNLVHASAGEIRYFGLDLHENEEEIFYILAGEARIDDNGTEVVASAGDSVIPDLMAGR